MSNGWNESAQAWIESLGEDGDFGRKYVLDPPMIKRIGRQRFRRALDIGCGEGRFCRIMRDHNIATVGIDPTEALVTRARLLDPYGDYRLGSAENLAVVSNSFDLVVSYLSLVDIADIATAVDRMVAALQPGGTLLVANLTSFNTAGMAEHTESQADDDFRFSIDRYLEERALRSSWRGISVVNWHRPLSAYFTLFLDRGLELKHFAEPEPIGGDPRKVDRYRRVPWFHIMEWRKPAV